MTKQEFHIKLPLMEDFDSIQGEGYHQGKAAYFVRLAGCDINCPWCDVKESWDAEVYNLIDIGELKESISISKAKIVVITGGEPLMYNLDELTAFIHSLGKKTHLETAGAHKLSGNWDWICVSLKKNSPPVESVYKRADELKVVIQTVDDFKWAEENAKLVSKDCQLYLQPEWSKKEITTPLIIEFVMKNPQWKISLQTHKCLNIP